MFSHISGCVSPFTDLNTARVLKKKKKKKKRITLKGESMSVPKDLQKTLRLGTLKKKKKKKKSNCENNQINVSE